MAKDAIYARRGEIMPCAEAALDVFRTVAIARVTPVHDQRAQAAQETSQRIFPCREQRQDASRTLGAGMAPEKPQGYGYGRGF